MRVDTEDGERPVAGIPKPAVFSIFAPVGFIGVDEIGCAYFFYTSSSRRKSLRLGSRPPAMPSRTIAMMRRRR